MVKINLKNKKKEKDIEVFYIQFIRKYGNKGTALIIHTVKF